MEYKEKTIEDFAIRMASQIKNELTTFLSELKNRSEKDGRYDQMLTEAEVCSLLGIEPCELLSMRNDRLIFYKAEDIKSHLSNGSIKMNGYKPARAVKTITEYMDRRKEYVQ